MQGPFLRKYGVQTTINFDLYEVDGVDLRVDAAHAAGDSKIMKDEGAEANTANGFTDEGSTYSIVLTATEMQAARIKIILIDSATKVWLDDTIVVETYGNASAMHAMDLDDAVRGGMTALPAAAADAAGGLAISDAGGLDLDTKLANTNEVTAARLSELDAGTAGKMANQVDEIRTDTGEIGTAGAGLTDLGGMATGMKAEVESEANDALVALNLDHLAKTATGGADMTTELPDNTILSRMLANGDTSAFDPSTDGLQPIRDTAPLGTAMRGTDSAALASVCTEARLAELAAANLPTDIAAIPTATENRDALTGGAYALDTDANGRVRIVDGTGAGELDTASGTVLLRSATETQIDNIEGDTNELQVDWANAGRLDALIDLILADTGELQTDWANGGRLDLLIDAILADTGTDGVVVATATRQGIADEILKRGVSNVEDVADAHSLATIILAVLESSLSGTTWTIKKTGGTTFTTKTVTVDADADPITAVT